MGRLKGKIPRSMKDHRTRAGRTYGEAVRGILERYPQAKTARVLVKQYGLIACELEALSMQIEVAREKLNRPLDLRRLKREQRVLRGQLLGLERYLAELSSGARSDGGLSALMTQGRL
jgi:hypothetical protein